MDEPPRSPVRVSDPGEMAAALPALVGFLPHESVVLVALGGAGGRRVVLTARADLPAGAGSASPVRQLVHAVGAEQPTGVLLYVVSEAADDQELLAFGPPGEVLTGLPHRALVHDLVRALAGGDVRVHDALLVRGGRWWSYDCPRPCCAPGAGTPLPGGVSEVEVAAVAAGAVVETSRGALAERIARVAGLATRAGAGRPVGPGLAVEDGWPAVLAALRLCRPGSVEPLPDAALTAVVWALTDLAVRDRALGLALGADAAAAEVLWTECTRRAPAPLDAAPATLLATAAWLRGDGAMANVALERALTSRPGYRLAELLADCLAARVHPSELRGLIADVVGGPG
ncbi:DUF4192 domain-containing protein [Blastococcus sp. TF02A-26]|uniref:DUF4192 domain-containing protein n=1 Tax=Blastococcus sp. TF02A-26 TaxID=2250577 RepID=UPI000DEA22CB|nr:DUF4192 domain-containing protein [Blastococcus sp. TF02A-26]RBY90562.1 DUF4192 domain-containing protein [Blastococcus sp. TF02A-26]